MLCDKRFQYFRVRILLTAQVQYLQNKENNVEQALEDLCKTPPAMKYLVDLQSCSIRSFRR